MKHRAWLMTTLFLVLAVPASAVETQLWVTDSPSDYARSDARGVVVGPDGVLAVGPESESSPAESLDVVWAVAVLGDGSVAIAGDRGRLMRVTRGKATIVLDTDESNLVSLVSDGKGGAYAGGDSKGRVFAVRAGGAVSTVFDASEDEVRALAVAPDGSLYAAALSSSSIVSDEPDSKDDDSDKVTPVTAPVSGSRAIVYRIVPDSSVTAVWTSPHPLVFALAALGGKGGPAKIVAGCRRGR